MGQIFPGGDEGAVKAGVKDQASGSGKIYTLLNFVGGGVFVDYMKEGRATKDYETVDAKISADLMPFLYNEGRGAYFYIPDLVSMRAGLISASELKGKDELDEGEHFKVGDVSCQYKKLCWKLDEMGAVGETALHVCLLNSTSIHADLAKRLLRSFPALINDIYISDEYFGENALHMAIVNEDPAMVKFLLDNGADFHQRACGNFFTADDQKTRRKDNLEHEWFDLPLETNFMGYTYWGEYPLGFAACLGQEECVRLLVAKGADPNLIDSNGCTVMHMLVVHDNKEMFDLLVDMGGKLNVINKQGLTPLTLAAKLGRKDMYEHILEIEREVFWMYGNVTCAAYPLEHIDTISATGEINTRSVMYQVIYGEEVEHLSMIDGIISQLLDEKWKTFARFRFRRRFLAFILYFIIFFLAIVLRPGTDTRPRVYNVNRTSSNGTAYVQSVTDKDPCYLLRYYDAHDAWRFAFEILTLLGSTIYLFLSLKEIYHQGYRIFFQTLLASPAKVLFLFSNIFVLLTVPGRAACAYLYEDVIIVLSILCCAPYFLFFCRGFKIVGPFVVMIYKMMSTDLLRFFVIYLIFVIGFSQSLYLVFLEKQGSIFSKPLDAIMGMFLMSLGDFGSTYESFEQLAYSGVAKGIFLVYMILVTLLLINMLIAMMGNTYQAVAETQGEWLRQWAKIILVVEQTVTTEKRRQEQINYSQPMSDDVRRALVIRWHQSEKEQEELRKQREEEKAKQRGMLLRRAEIRASISGPVAVEQAVDGMVNI